MSENITIFNKNDRDMIVNHMREHGYVVVNILSKTKAHKLKKEFEKWFFSLNKYVNTSSWNTMPDQILGIIKSYGIGQAEFMWKLRKNKDVKSIFRYLYDVDIDTPLISSYDGVCYHPKELAEKKENINLWTHVDIHPKKHSNPKYQTFQSLINLEDNTHENDGAFSFCPKTHKLTYDFYKDLPHINNNDDFFRVPLHLIKSNNIDIYSVHVPKGCMVIWDSRTIHCNIPPNKTGKPNIHDRLVAYVCMVPKYMVNKDTLEKLKLWKNTNRTTSHSPINPKVSIDDIIYNTNTRIKVKI